MTGRRMDNKKPTAVSSRGFLLKSSQSRQEPTASLTTRTTSVTCRRIPFITARTVAKSQPKGQALFRVFCPARNRSRGYCPDQFVVRNKSALPAQAVRIQLDSDDLIFCREESLEFSTQFKASSSPQTPLRQCSAMHAIRLAGQRNSSPWSSHRPPIRATLLWHPGQIAPPH
jgi:hypothetical protein